MTQFDFVGAIPAAPFKDIGNTRDSTAQEKARLCLELGKLIRSIPPRIKTGGSVNDVRVWKDDHAKCTKVASSPRASTQELRSAISRMQKWF
jgi:hypothetical protein